jgi:hypothetical protein
LAHLVAPSWVIAGTSYAISADGLNGSSGEILLRFAFAPYPPPPQPPLNDHFANRFPLVGKVVSTNGSIGLATREPGEPDHTGQPGHASAWWSWTAPESGYVRLALAGNAFDPLLAVYTGTHLSNLVEVASGQSRFLHFRTTSGEVYQIVVDANSGSSGFTLELELGLPPPNDTFTNRFIVSGFLTNLTGNNAFATSEQGEPLPGGATGQTLWWKWTAPSNGLLTVFSQDFGTGAALGSPNHLRPPAWPPGRSSGPLIAVYSGGAITNLTSLASNSFYFLGPFEYPPAGWRVWEQFNFPIRAGVTYAISIDGCNGSSGAFEISFAFAEAPPNDDFVNAFLLSGESASVVGSNVTATKESGEPTREGFPAASSVWWNWTAPNGGRLRINTGGSSFNPLIGVYRGDSLTNLTEVKTGQGSVEFFVIPGTIYKIALDGEPGVTGDFALNLALEPYPQNDNFANRVPLNGASVIATGSNVAATSEPGEPIHRQSTGRSVWWSWTAPASGTVRVEAWVDFTGLPLGIYVGTSVSTLLTIVDGINEISFYGVAGVTYEIAVADFNGLEGSIHLRLNGPPTLPWLYLSQTVKLPGGAFKGSVNAAPGQSFVIQASTNLVHWLNMIVETSIGGSLTFTDADASIFPHRFYRVVPLDTLVDPQGLALLTPPPPTSEGARLRLIGSAGRPFVLQASTDLVNWTNLASGLLNGDGFEFLDLESPRLDKRFYRALPIGRQR